MNTAPLWSPSPQRIARSRMAAFQVFAADRAAREFDTYDALWQWSVSEPAAFWQAVWDFCGVMAETPATTVLTDGERMPGARWFGDARLNFAENLLRYRDERVALVFRGETGHREQLTYAELHQTVARLAAALKAAGVGPGDRVAGFLPNLPETVIAMLAAASLGAIWSSCSPDFGVQGVLDRFGQIEPKVLFTADGYFYGGKTLDSLERVGAVLRAARLGRRPWSWCPTSTMRPPSTDLPNAVLWDDFLGHAQIDRHRLRRAALRPPALHHVLLGHHRRAQVHRARRRRHAAPAPEGAPAAHRRHAATTACSTSPPAAG